MCLGGNPPLCSPDSSAHQHLKTAMTMLGLEILTCYIQEEYRKYSDSPRSPQRPQEAVRSHLLMCHIPIPRTVPIPLCALRGAW